MIRRRAVDERDILGDRDDVGVGSAIGGNGRSIAVIAGCLLAAGACGGGRAAADGAAGQGVIVGAGGAGATTGLGGGGPGGSAGRGGTGGSLATPGPWPPLATTNDAATLTGTAIGTCPTAVPPRRTIPIRVNGGSPDFEIHQGYVMADLDNTWRALLFAAVTNRGTKMHCNIAAPPNGYDWYDQQGRSLNIKTGPTVLGSEGDIGMPFYSQSCLMPGETGIIVDAQTLEIRDLYTTAAGVTLALTYEKDGVPPAAAMVPQSYTLVSPTVFSVRFRNVGTGAGSFPPLDFGTFVLFDAEGLPMEFGTISVVADDTASYEVAAGAWGTAGNSSNVESCGVSVRPYIKFESLAAPHRP
jgi:hypothetical protein